MDVARAVTDEQVAAAKAERVRYRERIAALDVDVLVTPAIPMVAPPVGAGDLALRERMIELTFPWNVTGSPALALPCGPAEDGLPASVQLIGRPGEDALVLAAGRAFSQRRPGQRVQRLDDRQRLAAGGGGADAVVPDDRQAGALRAGHVAGRSRKEHGRPPRLHARSVRLRVRLVEAHALRGDQEVDFDPELGRCSSR